MNIMILSFQQKKEKKMEKFTCILQKLAEKIDRNKYLGVIKEALIIYVPITIIGSLASLFSTLICSETSGLASISGFGFLASLSTVFSAINFAGMSAISLGLVVIVGLLMGKRNGINFYLAGITAFVSYLTIIPTSTSATEGDTILTITNVIPEGSISAKNMMIGFFIAIIAVEFLTKLMKIEKIKIHMPDSVPDMIADSFNNMIPVLLTVVMVALIGFAAQQLSGQYITDLFYDILQKPIEGVMQSPVGILTVVFITNFLWVLGIHGGLVTRSVRVPFMLTALAANVAAVEAGGVASNPVTETFWVNFCAIGGSGNTIALLVVILLISKRQEYKSIAKLSMVPALFGINEPVVFGLPIVLNPVLAIPFILSSLATTALGLAFTYIGFIPCSTVAVPAGLPIIVQSFVGYAGSMTACIAVVICLVVAALIYAPFVLISNKMAMQEKEQVLDNER